MISAVYLAIAVTAEAIVHVGAGLIIAIDGLIAVTVFTVIYCLTGSYVTVRPFSQGPFGADEGLGIDIAGLAAGEVAVVDQISAGMGVVVGIGGVGFFFTSAAPSDGYAT